jgi:glycosyltransferase involved in cell wall biosynthesis
MSVLVDGRWFGTHGIGRYASEVIARLPDIEILQHRTIDPASLRDPLFLSRRIAYVGPSAFFSPGYNAAVMSSTPQLLVLHDLIHLDILEESSHAKRLYYHYIVRPAILRADQVITVSNFSRRRIAEWSGLSEDRITVAPGGCSDEFLKELGPKTTSSLGEYVLFVGNAKPHKNLSLLIEAMRYLGDLKLICVGVRDRSDLPDDDLASGRIISMNDLSDRDLAILYRNAECLALPSTYEGFGLPALESAALGTAVAYVAESVTEVLRGEGGVQAPNQCTPAEFAETVRQAIRQRPNSEHTFRLRSTLRGSWDRAAAHVAASLNEIGCKT